MKRMLFVVLAVAAMATAVLAQTDLDALRDKFLHAGPVLRMKAHRLLLQSCPELPTKLIDEMAARHPDLPTQLVLVRMNTLRDKHPEAWTTLPAQVLDDVHARHPRLVTRTMIDWWTVVGEKDPSALARRLEARAEARRTLAEKYPTLAEDVLTVVKARDPKLPAALRKDVARVVYDTDPSLPLDLALDVMSVCHRHPHVWDHLARFVGPSRLLGLNEAMAANPRFALELWTMIDHKYADRLFTVTRTLVATIGKQHGDRLQALAIDLVTMIGQKHPTLPYEVARQLVALNRQLARPSNTQTSSAMTELAASLQAADGSVMSDVLESVDRHSPTLRADLRAAVQARFPGLRDEVVGFVRTQCPDLIPHLMQL